MSYRQYTSHPPHEPYPQQPSQYTQGSSAFRVNRPSDNYSQPHRSMESQSTLQRGSFSYNQQKKAELKNKIKEIIEMCKDQNMIVTRDIAGVAEEEQKIYHHLQQVNLSAGEPTVPTQPNYPPTPTKDIPNPNFTPIRSHPEQSLNSGKNLQQDIRTMMNQNANVQLTPQALQLINQIERRCLSQIQKMRDEKLALIAQLNEEIKQHNITKRNCTELEKELDFYRKSQGAGGVPDGRYEQQLKDRVVYLENTLQQVQQQGNRPDHPDFKILFAQGEAIRQQTLRLLKMREAKGYGQDPQNQQLREQRQHLLRKIDYLQQQRQARSSKPSYQVINEEYSPIAPSHKRKNSYRNSANQYESLVMEMRKITNN